MTKTKQSKSLFVSVTNIPTPYRLHFYKELSNALTEKGVDFEVWFMANSEQGRNWKFDKDDFEFDYKFKPGIRPVIKNKQLYFNPYYLLSVFQKKPELILFSGSWFNPNCILIAFISRFLGIKTVFWSESNLKYIEYNKSLVKYIRSKILNQFDHYAVPGKFAEEYVKYFVTNLPDKKYIHLPNIVDENKFGVVKIYSDQNKGILKSKWLKENTNLPIFFTAARLEPIKGIKELLDGICSKELYKKFTLLIAGDGSQKHDLETMVNQIGGGRYIRILGFLPEKDILELLAISDAFILPSIGDPYPLSVIEAAFAGLPLLLSNRVGCYPEILIEEINGNLFDPENKQSIIDCISKFCNLGSQKWNEMGKKSKEIAEERFGTHIVIKNFVNDLFLL